MTIGIDRTLGSNNFLALNDSHARLPSVLVYNVFIYDLKQDYFVIVFVSNETFTLQCSKICERVEKVKKKMLDCCEV